MRLKLLIFILLSLFHLQSIGQGCGTTVYDTGGAGGQYGNNQNLTWTYCPPAGQVVTITFTAFNVEAGFDYLSVHNGATNAAPELGLFTGTALPPSITGTIPGGCITLWFTSDASVPAAGWIANITCATPPPPAAVCGTTVYDPGGAGGNYANNTNYTVTYCPSVAGQVVTMNFTPLSLWILNGVDFSGKSFSTLDDPSNLPTREFRIKVDSGIFDLPPNIDMESILESTIKDFMINTIMYEIQSGSGIEFGTLVSRYHIDRSNRNLVIQSRFKIIN